MRVRLTDSRCLGSNVGSYTITLSAKVALESYSHSTSASLMLTRGGTPGGYPVHLTDHALMFCMSPLKHNEHRKSDEVYFERSKNKESLQRFACANSVYGLGQCVS